jgi:hypothetical protein
MRLVEGHTKKSPFGRYTYRYNLNIEMDLKRIMCNGVDWTA